MSDQETTTNKLDRFVQRVRDRYAPSAALRALLKYGREEGLTPADFHSHVVDCVGLPEQLVRLLQTPSFQLIEPINNLEQTFELFNLGALHRLSIGLRLPHELHTGLEPNFQKTIWRATLIRAVAAAEFEPDAKCDAVAVALLPTLGVFVLARELGPSYIEFLNRIIAERGAWHELEQRSLEFDHRVAGMQLAPYWGVPDEMLRAWEYSHELAKRPAHRRSGDELIPQLTRSLFLADLLSEVLTLERPAQFEQFAAAWETHGSGSFEKLEIKIGELTTRVAAFADALHIPFDSHPTLHEVFSRLRTSYEEARAKSDEGLEQVLYESRSLAKLARQAKKGTSHGKPSQVTNASRTSNAGRGTAVCTPVELVSRIDTAISECRQTRCALSFVLMEMQENISRAAGPRESGPSHLAERLQETLEELALHADDVISLGPTQWAVMLCGFDKSRTVDAAKHLMSETREWSQQVKDSSRPVFNMSVGIASLALPPKNFPPEEMLDAAERCLKAAQSMGNDGVKSIDL